MIEYRDARSEDGVALGKMASESFVDTFGHLYRKEDLDAFLTAYFGPTGLPAQIGDPAYRIRVALDGETIVGFAKFTASATLPPPSSAADAELKQLYLLPAFKGAGVGAALMEWTLDQARSVGAKRIVLSVWVDNHRAKRFYARYGFVEIGAAPFAVGNQIDDDRIWCLDL
jgi:GNAT superfamily N-acetyltransferase